MPLTRYVVICTERNEEPPGTVIRTVDAPDAQVALQIVSDYHEALDGDWQAHEAITAHDIIRMGLDALEDPADL